MKHSDERTNVMRILDSHKVLFNSYNYLDSGAISGMEVGMKKFFRTVIHISASEFEKIIFSAGKIGYQVEVSLDDLKKIIKFDLFDIVD